MRVTIVDRLKVVFRSVDAAFGSVIARELTERGVEVVNNTEVATIESGATGPTVTAKNGWRSSAAVVLLVVGVRPASDLAREAGIAAGPRGGIRVNTRMETEIPGVYAIQGIASRPGTGFCNATPTCRSERFHIGGS